MNILPKFLRGLFSRSCTAKKCGHVFKPGKNTVPISMEGEISWRLDKDADWCVHCLVEMTIACAECKQSICIGDTVALPLLYDHHVLPSHATVYDSGKDNHLVKCLRCCLAHEAGGLWLPDENGKGKVVPFASAMNLAVVDGGQMVRIGDITSGEALCMPHY